MKAHVVMVEYSEGSDAFYVHSVYSEDLAARRASWALMREFSASGKRVYGRRHDEDWDIDVRVESFDLLELAQAKVAPVPACKFHGSMGLPRCYCLGKEGPRAAV